MGATAAGALNAKGFSSAIQSGFLPASDHLTYAGAFNEEYFRVGGRTDKLLDLYYGYSLCHSPLRVNPEESANRFVGLFLKSVLDGQQRTVPIHAVLVLDISGSMGGQLSRKNSTGVTRLDLSRRAIKMFFKKLNAHDVFSLVTFSNDAATLIPSTFVKDLDEAAVAAIVDRDFKMGGTVLKSGFIEAEKNFKDFNYGTPLAEVQHERRIIMLTDVCDNSMENENEFVRGLSDSAIHCTIIGVSEEFRSETCEKLVKIKGFNYFCATEDSDLQKYLVDNFDYTFFPAAYKVSIDIESKDILTYEVYGTPDSKEVHTYGNPALKNKTQFVVTRMESAFPSDFSKDKDGVECTQGGLMLVKFVPKNPEARAFQGKLILRYASTKGEQFEQTYPLSFEPPAEEFHSSETMAKATKSFYYTHCLKQLLDKMNAEETKLNDLNRSQYLKNLELLMEATPEHKRKEVESVKDIVEKFKAPEPVVAPV